MCDCVWPIEVFRGRVADEWIGQDQRVVHPDAPLGGGGRGLFHAAGVLNHDAHAQVLPHSQSPAGALVSPGEMAAAEQLQAANAPAKPPPIVTERTSTTVGRLEIVIEPDGSGGTLKDGAVTKPVISHSGAMRSERNPDKTRVLRFINEKKFKVVIQTVYHQGTPSMPSKYGRGKAPSDQATGDITLGFHESCHRADLLNFFTKVKQPEFAGRENTPATEFDQAFKDYLAAWKALEAAAEADSYLKTDEVDPKKSSYTP